MKSVVVYESMFGNTEDLAKTIAAALRSGGSCETFEVGAVQAADLADADLLVVGGPTHAWGMTKSFTRRSAATIAHHHLVSRGTSMRAWLKSLQPGGGRAAAAFDTRLDELRLSAGSASWGIGRRLRRRGYRLVVPPASFRVETTTGPLAHGELERAREWAFSLVKAGASRKTEKPAHGIVGQGLV